MYSIEMSISDTFIFLNLADDTSFTLYLNLYTTDGGNFLYRSYNMYVGISFVVNAFLITWFVADAGADI